MLKLVIPSTEFYDEEKGIFFTVKEQSLQLEHSLVSLSKWESQWLKPFFVKDPKTNEETKDYLRCMTISQNVDPNIYNYVGQSIIDEVNAYIDNPMTATTFKKTDSVLNREIITSEVIYYWMVALNIPFECQKWHLNRLLALINVCNIKNQPKKKMSKRDLYNYNASLNAQRKARMGSSG